MHARMVPLVFTLVVATSCGGADAVGFVTTKLAEGPLPELPAEQLFVTVVHVPQQLNAPITHAHIAGFVYTLSGSSQLAIEGGDTSIKAGEAGFVGAGAVHTHANPGPSANDWYFIGLRPTGTRYLTPSFPGQSTVYDTGDLPVTALIAGKHTEQLNVTTLEKGGRTAAHKHAGLEILVILAGSVQLRTASAQPVTLTSGKGAYVLPNTAMQVSNVGDGQAQWLAFFVTQEGQPLSTNLDTAP